MALIDKSKTFKNHHKKYNMVVCAMPSMKTLQTGGEKALSYSAKLQGPCMLRREWPGLDWVRPSTGSLQVNISQYDQKTLTLDLRKT